MGVAVGVGVHQDGAGGLAVAARAPDLLVVGLQLPGRPCGLMVRMSALSMPMPKAMVATITSMAPD